MSQVNIIQMIEKEKERGAPHTFWGEKDNRNNEIEESVFENCLTGTVAESSLNDHQSIIESKSKEYSNDKHLERDKISSEDIEEDSDILTKEKKNTDDSDETDYFDSEDEYWDTLINKTIEYNTSACLHCLSYHLPRSVNEYKTCKSLCKTNMYQFIVLVLAKHISRTRLSRANLLCVVKYRKIFLKSISKC